MFSGSIKQWLMVSMVTSAVAICGCTQSEQPDDPVDPTDDASDTANPSDTLDPDPQPGHRGGSFHAGRYRAFMRDGHLPADMNTEFRHRSYGFRCAL